MKLRLLHYIRCPRCRSDLTLTDPVVESIDRPAGKNRPPCSGLCGSTGTAAGSPGCDACARLEVVSGLLICAACGDRFPVDASVPRLVAAPAEGRGPIRAQTSRSFGHLWAQAPADPDAIPAVHHYEKLARTLSMSPPAGVMLDAGCGEGIDLANQARRWDVEIIGAELSDGGCRTTARRILHLPGAHVVQADLGRLPFADDRFDAVYSYGVLHHMAVPLDGLTELARVARAGAQIAVYLYEDFSERAAAWRWLLRAANSLRHVTTRVPPAALYGLCRVASPVVYLTFTVPYRLFRRVPGLASAAESIPFRHGPGPWQLTGDLYDRFSAPMEYRYSREGAIAFLRSAGLRPLRVGNDRGWMLLGEV